MNVDWPVATRTALRRGQLMVAEVEASVPRHRAWIAVYSIPGSVGTFNVFHREFDEEYMANDWCIGPDDGMLEHGFVRVTGEEQLVEALRVRNVQPSDLEYVHNSDYPV
ncbi:hypothetical protein [Kineosporia babensis]|uniref:Uncharacterized protein n=1 Tax=Kineosporia babensis TaxID=499548 RepID=A0A9X1NGA5_9ACTN|nr:hypothetical protein [Kineosporia babensis]MCD5313395.1 hypothetical protein [Kineosporia babensis]